MFEWRSTIKYQFFSFCLFGFHHVAYWRQYRTVSLTCDSAGAHLDERDAWRRHCRDGAAKERAANIFEGIKVFLLPNWSYTLEVAS
jgi:hypothetical protein